MNVPPTVIKSVMKAIYNLCDDDNYNVYDSEDIAQYLGLEKSIVEDTMELLVEARFVGECMNLHDDGIQTYHLTDRAIDIVEMG